MQVRYFSFDFLLSDDFMDSTFKGGTRTKSDILNGPRIAGRYHSIKFIDVKVRIFHDSGIVNGANDLEGTGSNDIVKIRFTDVFVKHKGLWKAVSAQEMLVN